MKKYSRRIFIAVLALILSVCSVMFVVGCSNKKPIQLVNFNDITIDVGYNTTFSIAQYMTAVDEDGNGYLCTATVKNYKGEEVELTFNTFEVTSIEDYTATLTIDLGGGNVQSRTITLNVVDDSLPRVVIGETFIGYVGEEYVLPQITATKTLGENITPQVKVYYVDNISSEEQSVVDGKFTPNKQGNYKIVATATDSRGNVGTSSVEFLVRSKMGAEVLEDFADSESANHIAYNTFDINKVYGTWSRQIELGGETRKGVVSLPLKDFNDGTNGKTGNENYVYALFNRNYNKLSLVGEDFEYVSIWVYLETEQEFNNNEIKFTNWAVNTPSIKVNKWQQVIISKDMILGNPATSTWSHYYPDNTMDAFWKMHAVDGTNERNFLQVRGLEKTATIYFDSISLIKSSVEQYKVPKSDEEFAIPQVKFLGIDDSVAATSDIEKVSVSYKTDKDATTSEQVVLTNGKFTTKAGYYTIKYTLCGLNETYEKEISFVVEKAMAANMLEDFDEQFRYTNVWNICAGTQNAEQKAQHQWLESYIDGSSETKTGVVSVNAFGNKFGFKVNKTVEELKALNLDANDTISITVMVTGLTYNSWFKIMGVLSNTITPNKWTTISVSVGDLITANTDLDTLINKIAKDTGTSVYGEMRFNAVSAATYYFDSITFTKNP